MGYAPLELTDKMAVIIGGTSGTGCTLAHGFAESGTNVIPTSRRMEQASVVAKEVEKRGRYSLRITADVADRASLGRLRDRSISVSGKVDILDNCAGRTLRAASIGFPETEWADIFDVNLTGTSGARASTWTLRRGA
jgi:NAD(P)-dependent dehydrogenase (short-subunit alcohol dehydrogenase family)